MGWRWRNYKFNFGQVKLDVPLRHLIKMSRKQLDTEVWISGERARRTVAIFHQVNPSQGAPAGGVKDQVAGRNFAGRPVLDS